MKPGTRHKKKKAKKKTQKEKKGDQLEREVAQKPEQEEGEKEKIEKQVREVIGKMGMQNYTPGFNVTNESPLAQHILEQPLPKGFKFPTLDVYSGRTDPASHV